MSAETDTFSFGFHSDSGPRETNQDTVLSIALPGDRWLLAIADGMGGLAEGELASKAALKTLYKSLSEGDSLAESVRDANSVVFEEAQGRTMGTTLVAAVFRGTEAEVANVGDSRAYQLDPFGLVQVTRDHTLGREVPGGGSASAPDAASARWAGALARFIGAEQSVQVDTFGPLHIQERGWVLLSSDGLHNVLSFDEMESFLQGETEPGRAARALVDRALAKQTPDNVSVALAFRRKAGPTEASDDETVFPDFSRPPTEPETESQNTEAPIWEATPASLNPEVPSREPETRHRGPGTPNQVPETAAQESSQAPGGPDQDLTAPTTFATGAARRGSMGQEVPRVWDPKKFVNRARPARERNQRTNLALRLSILVILLVVFLFVVYKWTLSPGTG